MSGSMDKEGGLISGPGGGARFLFVVLLGRGGLVSCPRGKGGVLCVVLVEEGVL